MTAKLQKHTARRLVIVGVAVLALIAWLILSPNNYQPEPVKAEESEITELTPEEQALLAVNVLAKLDVKDWYTATKYNRKDFYSSWATYNGCDMRNVILQRDLTDTVLDGCLVLSGILNDPYTGETINFTRGKTTSSAVQIDHVVALSNAWQTGAANLEKADRHALSQDPLNLLAVDGPANQQKSDKDASNWLPSNIAFRCQYVARQISVKSKYFLWVTQPEKTAMQKVLDTCPQEPTVGLENDT